MNIIFSLISHSFQAVVIGLLVVAVLMALTFMVIKGFNPRARLSAPGVVTTALTSLLLLIQTIPAIAALKIKSTALDFKESLNSLNINELSTLSGGVIFHNS